MLEKNFENKVKKYLDQEGCWFLKTWSNGIQRKGIPDLLVCCNGYFVAVELKNETGRASPLQIYEINEINRSGGHALVLRPTGFEDFKNLIKELKNGKF